MDLVIMIVVVMVTVTMTNAEEAGISCYSCDGDPTQTDCLSQLQKCKSTQQSCLTLVRDHYVQSGCSNPSRCRLNAAKQCTEIGCYSCCDTDRCNYLSVQDCHQQPESPCDSNPCQNGGTCEEVPGEGKGREGFVCNCPPDFNGDLCEVELTLPCDSNPCQNGGACVEVPGKGKGQDGEFDCTCPPDFSGDLCEVESPCISNPCENGGTCEWVDNPGKGKSGNTEEQKPRKSRQTGNHVAAEFAPKSGRGNIPANVLHIERSREVTATDEFVCHCPPEFSGDLCEVGASPCGSNPCQNGGTCEEVPGEGKGKDEFECQCPPDFSGDLCQVASPCGSSPCQNGGTCEEVPGEGKGRDEFECQCPPDFSGDLCEVAPPCDSDPCHNGGTCKKVDEGKKGTTSNDEFVCECPPDFTGELCETEVCSSTAACVSDCSDMSDGDYQSCHGCEYYCTCAAGNTYDLRPCPAGLVWDDNLKRCEYTSDTCC